MRLLGVASATLLSYLLTYFFLRVKFSRSEEMQAANISPSAQTLFEFNQYLVQALHPIGVVLMDYGAWELLIIYCGFLGSKEQTTQVIFAIIMAFGCAIGYGAQTAANMLITKQIQKSKAGDARRYFRHLSVMTALFSLFVMAVLLVTSQQVLHSMFSPVSSQIVGGQINTKDREMLQGDGSAIE